MKIKYKFEEINSVSDTIKVTSGTEDLIILKKSDFEDNWDNALNKDYYINDFQCGDLGFLTITGTEDHTAVYTDQLNKKWKEFTQNKVGSKHLTDTLVLNNIDAEKPVIAYNQDAFTSTSDVRTLVKDYYNKLKSITTKIDFSKLDVSNFNSETSNLNYLLPTYYIGGSYYYLIGSSTKGSDINNSFISKWFDLPEGITSMTYAFYGSCITELPKIPSTVTNISCAFSNCTKLVEVGNLNCPNATGTDIFTDCTSLTSIGNISLDNINFSRCYNLKKIGNITSNSIITINCNTSDYKSSLQEIGDLTSNGVITIGSSTYPTNKLVKIGNICNTGTTALMLFLYDLNVDGSIGNITNFYRILCGSRPSSIGIINYTNDYKFSNYYTFASALPYKCIAIPNHYCAIKGQSLGDTSYIPSSTGTDLWFDYNTYTDNEYIHNITNPVYNITEHKETMNNVETAHSKGLNVLEKNAAYDHTFELVSCSLYDSTSTTYTNITGTNISTTDTKFTLNEDGTADIDIPCTNIKDDSVSSGTITRTIFYVAKIDGNEFHGATTVSINFSYTWTVNESVVISTEILDDNGDVIDITEESDDTSESTDTTEETIESTDDTSKSADTTEETIETTEDTDDNASTEDN